MIDTSSKTLSRYALILLGLAALYVALETFQSFLRPFSIAILLTFLTISFYRQNFKTKIYKLGSIFLVVVLSVALVYSLFFFSGTSSEEEIRESAEFIDQNSKSNLEILENFKAEFDELEVSNLISYERIQSISQEFISVVFGSISVFLSELLLVILFYIFIIPSYDSTLNHLQTHFFKRNAKEFKDAVKEIEQGIKSYLSIKLLVSLGTALSSGVVLAIYGSDNILLLMIVFFVLNFIPNIGSFIAVFVAVVLFTLQAGISSQLVIFALLLIIIQLIFGNFIEPKISGRGLNMPPILILLSLFFWGSLWGLGGMLISVPLTHAIKTIIEKITQINSVEKRKSHL